MRHDPRDSKGYYRVLNLSPGADPVEVKLAYSFLKNAWQANRNLPRGRIKEAYDCLSNPARKKQYDAANVARGMDPERMRMVAAALVLGALLAFGGFVFPGFLKPGPSPFYIGDRLLTRTDALPLGEVVDMENDHPFPNGRLADAYLVRMEDGGRRWFPTGDLERNYRTP